ncbi:hypothetical protein [Clostridium sp. DJ247]|uniref:hypothetical protein n=1 Tax=Clostridium sp. DJ247 TaxID=2726188 RepID=UPI0016298230|nr:hypothetical protein [Clostridium sp. DJ247]MBC2578893.1 hypothetical protein [Clostridium sp. DJ247]
MASGSGSDGHCSYNFIVSPPLPYNISGLDLVFKECKSPLRDEPTCFEVVIHLE